MEQVLVVGAGPVGLTLAAELARHGIACRLIERRAEPLPYCRAIGVTPRTLEIWEDMGIARAAIDAGLWLRGYRLVVPGQPPRDVAESFPELPYGQLGLPQYETERILSEHLAGLGGRIERGVTLTDLAQREDGLQVTLERADGRRETASIRYLVGCDGAHSRVRHAAGIAFEGEAWDAAFMLGDVRIGWDLPRGLSLRAIRPREDAPPDLFIAIALPEPGRYRVSALAPPELSLGESAHGLQTDRPGPTLAQLQAAADLLLAERPPLTDLRWSSTFRISMRLAARYRQGNLFLAGDAAHIHPPTGGQGMNTGIQDAYNLAWKLALVVRGKARPDLLDSYEAERRPVGAEVIARTRAASESMGREQGPRDRLADTQIRVTYRGTPWVGEGAGERAPDCQGLRRAGLGFPLRLFELLRGTAFVLLARAGADPEGEGRALGALAARYGRDLRILLIAPQPGEDPPPGVVRLTDAEGAFAAAYGQEEGAWLVRPDGHIGWRGGHWSDPGLTAFLAPLLGGT